MIIHPGDLLHGDEHGILQIPAEALPDLLDAAEQIRTEEQQIIGWARSAEFSVEGLLALRRVRHQPNTPDGIRCREKER
jgi:4-hydroxy-4-methyl-2-oxoglutarate aldolase